MTKTLLDFIKLPVVAKIAFYRNVIAKMRANSATFTNPDKDLGTVSALVDTLNTKYIDAQDGGKSATAAMHEAEEAVDTAFRILVSYVDRVANSNETIILLSGFNPSQSHATPVKPELKADDGNASGSVKLVARAVEDAGAYIWQVAKDSLPADASGWAYAGFSTQASFPVTGLTAGSKYYFRFASITPTGVTDFTEAIGKIVV